MGDKGGGPMAAVTASVASKVALVLVRREKKKIRKEKEKRAAARKALQDARVQEDKAKKKACGKSSMHTYFNNTCNESNVRPLFMVCDGSGVPEAEPDLSSNSLVAAGLLNLAVVSSNIWAPCSDGSSSSDTVVLSCRTPVIRVSSSSEACAMEDNPDIDARVIHEIVVEAKELDERKRCISHLERGRRRITI